MKQIIVLVVLISTLLPVLPATASFTRVYTMGDVNLYVKDYANIYLFPSAITRYTDLAFLESAYYVDGENLDYGTIEAGVLLGLGNAGRFGFVINRLSRSVPYMPWYYYGYYPEISVDSKFNLFYGTSFNDSDMGLSLYWLGSSCESKLEGADVEYEEKLGATVLGGQVGWGKKFQKDVLESSLWFEKTFFTNEEEGETISQPEGYRSLGMRIRYFHQVSEKFVLVPFVSFQNVGHGYSVQDTTFAYVDQTSDTDDFSGGLGINLFPKDNVMVVLYIGASVDREKVSRQPNKKYLTVAKETSEAEQKEIPFYGLGLEAQLANWLTCRFGANKHVISSRMESESISDLENTAEEYKFSRASSIFYLGAGLEFGSWIIDVEVNDRFLQNGPNFLSGYEGSLFPRVSITKNF